MADPSTLLGPLDALRPYAEYVVLGLIVLNMGTRALAQRRYNKVIDSAVEEMLQDDGDDDDDDDDDRHPVAKELRRFLPHELSNVLLILGAFYYMTVHHHGGMVMSVLALGLFVADFFEFEARKVDVRSANPRKIETPDDVTIDRPKGAIAASMLVLSYALYQTAFFIVKPVWSAIF